MSENALHIKYRPDIDGLRAIAVLSVVLYHAFPSSLSGGFLGVDIFFVISGFLISTILFQNIDRGSFSILDFYSRRIRRIFPALALVLASILVFGWFCLYPSELQQLGKHAVSSAGFIQNFTLWKETGYFDNASDTKPLLHIWSLGIEEQFYFVWPLLLWVAGTLGNIYGQGSRKRLFYFLATVSVFAVSFGLNLDLVEVDPTKTFYLPQYRFFELALGGILSWGGLYQPKNSIQPKWFTEKWLKNVLSFIGLSVLLIIFGQFSKETVFPGKMALLPIFATAFIIWAGPDSWLNRKILSNKILVWFGLISFPLYLWHWPILSFGRIIYDEIPTLEFRLAAIALSVLLAWLTVKIIEKPFRFGTERIPLKLATLCVLVFGIGGLGRFIQNSDGFPKRFKGTTEQMSLEYTEDLGKPAEAKIMLLGDSHSAHFASGIKRIIGKNLVADYSNNGCIPFYNVDRFDHRMVVGNCEKAMTGALKDFEKNKNMTGIILSSMGPVYLDGTSFGDTDTDRVEGLGVTISTHPEIKDRWAVYKIGLTETLTRLTSLHKKVLFIYDVPELGFYVQECLPPRPMATKEIKTDCFVRQADFKKRTQKYRELVQGVLKNFPTVKVFDPSLFLCDNNICRAKNGDNFIYRDCDHLSNYGSAFIVEKMKSQILGLL